MTREVGALVTFYYWGRGLYLKFNLASPGFVIFEVALACQAFSQLRGLAWSYLLPLQRPYFLP